MLTFLEDYSYFFVYLGIGCFAVAFLFQLVTLPVEFNASRRAVKILNDSSILSGDELSGAKKVLGAAALTYVAALFNSVLQLLRLLMLTRRRKD